MIGDYGLIASIDPSRGEAYRRILAGVGLDAVVMSDGHAAREAISTRGAPGLVVTDLSLPRIDGFQLLGVLRRLASAQETPAIVVSEFADLRDAAERLRTELGICAILAARASAVVVQRVVKRALEREQLYAIDVGTEEELAEPPRARSRTSMTAYRWRANDPLLRDALDDVVKGLGVTYGFVSLLVGDRPQTAATVGLSERGDDIAAICQPVISAGAMLVIPDSTDHPLFAHGGLRVRGFAASPISTSRGEVIGVLGVAEDEPLMLGPDELERLHLHARRFAGELELASEAVSGGSSPSHLAAVLSHLDSGVALVDAGHRLMFANVALGEMCDLTTARMAGMERAAFVEALAQLAPDAAEARRRLAVIPGRYGCRAEIELASPRRRVLRWVARPLRIGHDVWQLEVFEDITAAVDLARERELLARTDWLTGLINRRGGEEALGREVARARRLGTSVCLALFDIDRFKLVNDIHGHPIGDEVLRGVARVLLGAVRGSDLAVRWGGDELLVILPAVPEAGARVFAERVRKRVAALEVDGAPAVTVSCGVAELTRYEDVTEAVTRADQRLYEAKAEGRNRVK